MEKGGLNPWVGKMPSGEAPQSRFSILAWRSSMGRRPDLLVHAGVVVLTEVT